MAGTFFGILIMGLIQTYIVFDGTLSSWWTKIVIGILLFTFIMLQKGLGWATTARKTTGNRVRDLIMSLSTAGDLSQQAFNNTSKVVEQLGMAIVSGGLCGTDNDSARP